MMDSSTRWTELARVANNHVVANEGWIVPLRFEIQVNQFVKKQEEKDAISTNPKWKFLSQPSRTEKYQNNASYLRLIDFPRKCLNMRTEKKCISS